MPNPQQIIDRLQNLTQLDIQNNWYFTEEQLSHPPTDITEKWQKGIPNDRQYLVWEKGEKIRWFAQKIIVPYSLNEDDFPLADLALRIKLTWWAESAQVFVDGELVNEGDLFDSSCRVLLTNKVTTHQEFLLSLRLVSPSHDIGGLMISRCLYESEYDKIDPSYVSNELSVIHKYIHQFYPQQQEKFTHIVNQLNWDIVDNKTGFFQELINLRNALLPLSKYIKERSFNLLGHAHLDMAWLWTIEETYSVAQRTFNSVLNLQQEYPHLTFGHTTAYLYQWIEENNPPLFKQIKKSINSGKWEVLGGMWVEPEVNLVKGESLIRQLLYGQNYYLAKFGQYNRVAWLPDTFGFPWQLPQILKQAKIDYFVTGKLHWNDSNKFPYGCFWWQSPDGSQIFSVMSPPNVAGVMDTHPEVMTDYSVEWESNTDLQDSFWLPGVGDHGGGPTRDMLKVAQRYQNSPFFPQINFTTASQYLDNISSQKKVDFPLWNDELYLELHRGCYTTHGDQKKYNRQAEIILYQAELFATINYILDRQYQPDFTPNNRVQKQIESLWKKVLLNQFHDILPGTSITPVFTASNQLWQEVLKAGEDILNQALNGITGYLTLADLPHPEAKVIAIFNSLNWNITSIIALNIDPDKYTITDDKGKQLTTQISHDRQLLFVAENIPSIGYKIFYIIPQKSSSDNLSTQRESEPFPNTISTSFNLSKTQHNPPLTPPLQRRDGEVQSIREKIPYEGGKEGNKMSQISPKTSDDIPQEFILENEFLKVIVNEKNGNLTSIYDKINHKEIIRVEGNELQLFQDQGQYWDAWNIDHEYQNKSLTKPQLTSIYWLEKGQLRQIIRIEKIFNKSSFIQDYILEMNSPLLGIKNQIDWQEDYTLLKVNFPFTITSDIVTHEIACGSMEKTTKPQTPPRKSSMGILSPSMDRFGRQ